MTHPTAQLRGTLKPRLQCPLRKEKPLEGLSNTANNQAILNPFHHNIKMKEYMKVWGGGPFYPRAECPPLLQVNSDCVHRDETGEIVSSILLKGYQKLQTTRPFSIPFIITKEYIKVELGRGTLYPGVDCPPLLQVKKGEIVSCILLKGFQKLKQVAQRATIAHLSPMCQGQPAPKPYAVFPPPQ